MVKIPDLKTNLRGLFSVLPKYNATYPSGKGRVTVRQPHQTPQSLSITRVKVYGHGYPWLYTQIDKNENPLYYPKLQDLMRSISGDKIRNIPGVLLLNSAPSFVIEPKYRRSTGSEFWLRKKTNLGKEVPPGWDIFQYRQAKKIIGKLKPHYDVRHEQVQAVEERPLNEKEKEPFSAMRFVLTRKTPISLKVSGGVAINEKGTVTDVWSDGDPEKDAEAVYQELRKPAYWEPNKEYASPQQKVAPVTAVFKTIQIDRIIPSESWAMRIGKGYAKEDEGIKRLDYAEAERYSNLKGFLPPYSAREEEFLWRGRSKQHLDQLRSGDYFPPIKVEHLRREHDDNDIYIIKDGHHRYAAAKLKGLDEVVGMEFRLGKVSGLNPYKTFSNEPKEEMELADVDLIGEYENPEIERAVVVSDDYATEPTEEELSFVEAPDEPPPLQGSSSKMLRIGGGDEEAR